MPVSLQSPVAKALEIILHGSPPVEDSSVLILDYRVKAIFNGLWLNGWESSTFTINGDELDWNSEGQQILLVGNKPPDGISDNRPASLQGINYSDHLTATSWLAAWKLKFPDAKAQIAVIDPHAAELVGSAARALKTLFSARDAQGNALVPRATVLNAPDLHEITGWLSKAKEDKNSTPDNIPDLLKSTIWHALTGKREDHHSISNVLGSLLLSTQVGRGNIHSGGPWIQDYLLALVRACGIEAGQEQVKVKEHGGNQRWLKPAIQKAIGATILIDDMADLWEHFLRGAFGFAGDAAFGETGRSYRESFEVFGENRFSEEISQLPGRLTKFFESGRRRFIASDLLGSDQAKIDEHFVLFLDLRLFGKGDAQLEDDYFAGLFELGKKLLATEGRHLPWLDARKFTALEEELDGGSGHPRETLLPRLLALLDPTLPIVIFSSTHRTELIDPFRDYGNIITAFRKPILTGLNSDWEESVRELYADFSEAMNQAASILSTRSVLKQLEPTSQHRNETD